MTCPGIGIAFASWAAVSVPVGRALGVSVAVGATGAVSTVVADGTDGSGTDGTTGRDVCALGSGGSMLRRSHAATLISESNTVARIKVIDISVSKQRT